MNTTEQGCQTRKGLEPCGQPMEFLCQFCGGLCIKHLYETPCTNGQKHTQLGE